MRSHLIAVEHLDALAGGVQLVSQGMGDSRFPSRR
jgi:hypothetical protein